MAACDASRTMGGTEAMAVIGIGTTSRVTVEDVLAVIEAARKKMCLGNIPPSSHSPQTSPGRGDGAGRNGCEGVPSALAGEGQDEGGFFTALAVLDRPAINPVLAEAAREARLALVLLTLDQLLATAHLCVTYSEKSMTQYGIPSLAEAAALAAAGKGARLILPRFCGRNTTAGVAS